MPNNMNQKNIPTVKVNKVVYRNGNRQLLSDVVVNEQPLQICVLWQEINNSSPSLSSKIFSITMRTPGDDKELAIGLLLSEGVVQSLDDIERIDSDAAVSDEECKENEHYSVGQENRIDILLVKGITPHFSSIDKYQMTYSSCGLCGTTSMNALEQKNPPMLNDEQSWLNIDSIYKMPDVMKHKQATYKTTGGQHAAALFNNNGQLIKLSEDIGRHNALDKLIGSILLDNTLVDHLFNNKLSEKVNCHPIILLSSRVSFEMVQKVVMSGISVLVAVGAPSSLAIAAAKRFNLTLIGFTSSNVFNVYSGDWRIGPPTNSAN